MARDGRAAIVILQSILAAVFLSAGLDKLLLAGDSLVRLLNSIGLEQPILHRPIAAFIGASEVVLGVLLLVGFRPVFLARVSLVLLTIYTAFLVYAGFRTGWAADCGCRVLMTSGSIGSAIGRNVILIGVATILCLMVKRHGAALQRREHGRPACGERM